MNQRKMTMNFVPRRSKIAVVAAVFLATAGSTSTNSVRAAGEYATLSVFSGHVGSVIQISGGNFLPNEALSIYGGQQIGTVSAVSHSDGSFGPISFTIPSVASGALPITVSGGTEMASNSFYVQPFSPDITLSASSVVPFSSLAVGGTGFMPGETVNVTLASAAASATVDKNGAFAGLSLSVPNIPAGTQKVVATGANSAASATGYEYINGFYASVSPSAAYLTPGQTLSFNGSGFAPAEAIDIFSTTNGQSERLVAFPATMLGDFKNAGSIVIPADQAGKTTIYSIVGETSKAGGSVSVSIGTLNPLVSLSSYYLVPGSIYTVSVSGYLSGEKIDLIQGGVTLGTLVANTVGAGTFTGLTFPASTAASLTYIAAGQTSKASSTASITVGQYHPFASVDNSYAVPGTPLMVSGGGFGPGEKITVSVGGGAVTVPTIADKLGNFANVPVVMPEAAEQSGMSSITVNGQFGEVPVSIALTVAPFLTQLAPSNYYVAPGSIFKLNGTGFAANETVTVSQGALSLGSIKADKNGSFAFPVTLPFGTASLSYVATGTLSKAPAKVSVSAAAFNATASLSSYSGTGGSAIVVSGTGYAPSEVIDLTWDGSSIGTFVADAKGSFKIAGNVPYAKVGSKVFVATGEKSGATSSASFSLVAFNANVTLSTYFAIGGSPITVSGSGFAANETVDLIWDGMGVGSLPTDVKGNFKVSGYVPNLKAGAKVFSATGKTSGAMSTAAFTQASFTPNVGLSAYYGAGGSPITITGTGFAANETVSLVWDGKTVGALPADAQGNFKVSGFVPYSTSGDKLFTASGNISNGSAAATYTVAKSYVSLKLSSYAGIPGDSITFIGSGYLPGETLNVTNDRAPVNVYSFKADDNGSFNDSGFIIHSSFAKGNLTFTLVGEHSFTPATIIFYVTSK